jgi:hypothetical protein
MAAFAGDLNQGTWKLNESKSKIAAGASKNTSVVYSTAGDSFHAVVEGVDGSGNPTHNEWTGKYDGKDYAVTGDPQSDTRAIKQLNEHKFELTVKKDGKVTASGSIEISKDGKTRTVSTHSTDAKGNKVKNVFVYDKQG